MYSSINIFLIKETECCKNYNIKAIFSTQQNIVLLIWKNILTFGVSIEDFMM